MARIEPQILDVHAPIEVAEAKHALATGSWGDDAALKLIVSDALTAENFESQKAWVMGWPTAIALYQSPYSARFWDGTQVERANIPLYTVATAVNALVPQVINGLFADNPPFVVQPRPGTRSQAARADGAVLAYQLEDINFREELRLGTTNAVLAGTAIFKWGWETYSEPRTVYKRKHKPLEVKNPMAGAPAVQITDDEEELETETVEETFDRPFFEHIVNLRHVLVDPSLNVPDIRKAKYVIHRMYVTWDDLEKLRDRPGFNLPSKQDLMMLFFPPKEEAVPALSENQFTNPLWDATAAPRFEPATADPFGQPLELLERWDGKRYMVALQQKLVVCNSNNPYGTVPFLSVNLWDVPESFWGLGLAKTIGSEQRLQQGITNIWLDQASLNLSGVYVRIRGKNVPTQPIRVYPGKIVDVEDKDGFKPLDRLPAVPEAAQHLAMSQARAEQVSGANQISTQGLAGQTGHSNLARSSAGAQLIGAGSENRTADFVEKLANQVIIPFLDAAHEMNCALLPLGTLRAILGEELQHEYLQDKDADLIELKNARLRFSILAGAKMQARRNMAQALPIISQMLMSPVISEQLGLQAKKIDIEEVLRMWWEVSDWRNFRDVVVPMSPEDQKRWQMMQPSAQGAQKAQAANALEDKKFQQKQQLLDQENYSRAGRDVLRHAFETSANPEAVTGEAGGLGFGSQS